MMYKRYDGFTLVELLMVVAILGVLINVSSPSYKQYLAKKDLQKTSRYLSSALNLARSEAAKRNVSVYVVPENSTSWEDGWAVTSNAAKSYSDCVTSGTDCYLAQGPLENVSFQNTPTLVTYTGSGRLTAGTTASFDICSNFTVYTELTNVLVSASGRPKIRLTTAGC